MEKNEINTEIRFYARLNLERLDVVVVVVVAVVGGKKASLLNVLIITKIWKIL